MRTARETALLTLYEIEYNGVFSNIGLKNSLAKADLDSRDKALCSAIVYGVISNKRMLDYIIEQFSKLKLKKISKYILLILRMGVYQIKFMEKIPASAAVDECVKLARRYGHNASAGYVNGVLRTVSKTQIKLPDDLSVLYSIAQENALRLKNDYGEKAWEIISALNEPAKLTVRANRMKCSPLDLAEKLGGEVCPIVPDAVYVKGLDVTSSKEYKAGLFTVQDAAPQAACLALGVMPGDFVMDLCAAPGGKTTYLAELMQNKGKIFAFDLYEHRAELIKKNAERLGINIIDVFAKDTSVLMPEYIGKPDKVLADVPCSGIGIAKRKPELKYKTDFDGLSKIQMSILSCGARYLKPGGVLVYSTCTLYRDENENIVNKFIEENEEYELLGLEESVPESFAASGGMLTVLPNEIDCDGFFIAKLRRKK